MRAVPEATLREGTAPVTETDDQGVCGVPQNSRPFTHALLSAGHLPNDDMGSVHRRPNTAAGPFPVPAGAPLACPSTCTASCPVAVPSLLSPRPLDPSVAS